MARETQFSLVGPEACNFIKETQGTLSKKASLILKKDSYTGVFCEYPEIFKNTFFYRILPVIASAENAFVFIFQAIFLKFEAAWTSHQL